MLKIGNFGQLLNMKIINVKKRYCKILGGNAYDVEIDPQKSTNNRQDCNIWIKLLTGVLIGFVNGFWGGGGGMICVPLLSNVVKLPDKKSHATTLLIMLPLCIASLVVYFTKGNLPLEESWQVCIGFVMGGLIGASLLKKISNVWLGVVFSLVIIVGGIKMLI